MSLYETIGNRSYENLLADGRNAETIAINMEPGNGTVKRGTVVYRKETGFWAPAAAGNAVITNQLAVLDEEVDTTGTPGDGSTTAAVARAFRSGNFITGKVTLASDAAVTDAAAATMRTQGIVFDQMAGGATFDNKV